MRSVQENNAVISEAEFDHSKLILRADGILEMHCSDDAIFDTSHIQELVSKIGVMTNGKKCKQITIAGAYTSVTKEGREYMATDEAVLFTTVEAYVIQSLAQRILGNFYLKFNKPKVPTKMFTDREKAEKWLKNYAV